MYPLRRPPLPYPTRSDSQGSIRSNSPALSEEGAANSATQTGKSRLSSASIMAQTGASSQAQQRLFGLPDDSSGVEASGPPRPFLCTRRKTDDGRLSDQRAEAPAVKLQRCLPAEVHECHDAYQQRRLSMPGEISQSQAFRFPNVAPMSKTVSGGTGLQQRSSQLAQSSSGAFLGFDGAYPMYQSPRMLSPRPISRATTPLHSGYPTPRSSINGSVYGSPSELRFDERGRHMKRMLSGVERGLDTPVWVARLRLLGRLLLAGLFANMLWQELREWRILRGHGWRQWYDLSWATEEMPPLPSLLSLAALALLVGGWSTSLAVGYLALRLLVQTLELREEIIAVLMEQTSNLLPVKELAVVGTVIVFIGHTYYVPEWVRGGKRAKGKATGLMYTQQWRPGKAFIILLGQLLIAPLFMSICALQYYDLTNAAVGFEVWKQRLLHPYYWYPPGDSSDNNWLPAQAVAYVLLATGMSNKRIPALLAALLLAEAFTCWRFWSTVWMSRHYVWYLRRHFTANLAIAGGLLLNLPEGKHDAVAVRRESTIGRKRT